MKDGKDNVQAGKAGMKSSLTEISKREKNTKCSGNHKPTCVGVQCVRQEVETWSPIPLLWNVALSSEQGRVGDMPTARLHQSWSRQETLKSVIGEEFTTRLRSKVWTGGRETTRGPGGILRPGWVRGETVIETWKTAM